MARGDQPFAMVPGVTGTAHLVMELPLVARGGELFVHRSFSPVTTIGGGVVLGPFPPQRTRLRRRRIVPDQTPALRLEAPVVEAGLTGVATDTLAVRLGVAPRRVTTVIAEVGDGLLALAEMLVASAAVTAEAARLAEGLRRRHKEHPLDPGMSLQALRATVGGGAASSPPPAAVVDA